MVNINGKTIPLEEACLAGIRCYLEKRPDDAVDIFSRVIEVDPYHSRALNALAVIANEGGDCERALSYLDALLTAHPAFDKGHNTMGTVFRSQGKLVEAEECFNKAVALNPSFAEANGNLGAIYLQLEKWEAACNCYRKVITLSPGSFQAYYGAGVALSNNKQYREAIESLQEAVRINPDSVDAYAALGDIYLQLKEWEAACKCYRRVLDLSPDSFQAYYGKGVALSNDKQYREAIESLREAVKINHDSADAYAALIMPLQRLGMLGDAITACETALRLKPDSSLLYNALGNLRLSQGFPEETIKHFRQALAHNPQSSSDHSNIILAMHYIDTYSPAEILKESRQWERQHALERVIGQVPTDKPLIRIGYVSADFKHHVVSYFFEPLLTAHDRTRFQIYCYADVAVPDGKTSQLAEMADCWVDIARMPDKELAERIVADGIDILVDLAGHTANNRLRLFTMKPAPVQVTWLGYPGTTGLSAMDYRISDGIADPEGVTDSFHTETVVRLPGSFLCYLPPTDSPEVSPLPAHSREGVTFGSFNNLAKITPAVLATWGKLLKRVPNSRLLLKNRSFSDETTCRRFFELLDAEGGVRNRVQLLPHARNNWHHLAHYWKMDISLDTFPYNGTTTTFESLWMGVPVITLAGDHHAARVGASILSCLGLDDLVAETVEGYIDKAVKLAHNLKYVYRLRQTLRQRLANSALCDAAVFARRMEEAYLTMLEKSRNHSQSGDFPRAHRASR